MTDDAYPITNELELAIKVAEAFSDWKHMVDDAEQHPGNVRPEFLGELWERAMDLLDQWMLSS